MDLDLSAAISNMQSKPDDLIIKLKFDTSPFDKIYSCAIIYYEFDASSDPGMNIPTCTVLNVANRIILFKEISDTTLIFKLLIEFKTAVTYPPNPVISAYFYYNNDAYSNDE